MQLLSSRGYAAPEFAALSVLVKANVASGTVTSQSVGEPVLIPAPSATLSQTECLAALEELRRYVNLLLVSSRSSDRKTDNNSSNNNSNSNSNNNSKDDNNDRLFLDFLQQDKKLFDEVQVFRPFHANGLALHYRVICDRTAVSRFVPLLLSSDRIPSENTTESQAAIENVATGVVLCVGFTGLPYSVGASSSCLDIEHRIADCIRTFTKTGTLDTVSSRTMIAALLLNNDDDRISNHAAERSRRTLLSAQHEAFDRNQKPNKLLAKSKRGQGVSEGGIVDNDIGADMHTNSSDLARITVERLAVLSVAENDAAFRKYEARAAAADERASKSRRKKTPRDADLDNFDFKGEKRSSSRDTSVAPSSVSSALSIDGSSIVSSSSNKLQLRGAKKDTRSSLGRQTRASVPALSAPRKDAAGYRNRRQSADATVTSRGSAYSSSSRRTSTGNANSSGNEPSGNWTVDSNGHSTSGNTFNGDFASKMQSSSRHQSFRDDDSKGSGRTPTGSLNNKLSRARSRDSQFDPFVSQSSGEGSVHTGADSAGSGHHRRSGSSISGLDDHGFGDDMSFDPSLGHGGRSVRSGGTINSSSHHEPRMQINVAVNEDLSCSYKMLELSSCSIEGFLQVQVKSNIPRQVPFYLVIRDPSRHIHKLSEDRRYMENVSSELAQEPQETRPDYKFTIAVPQSNEYFPVIRYKCSSQLRPVPMRVQTRVRREEAYWRVAVQISSNPHNKDNLTDLTIIMGVPEGVLGETLVTFPSGGMWNVSKRTVIWCVSELSGGEKFQLQATFEADPSVNLNSEQPKFPVIVRCQCMYSQLSDIKVEVRDIPDVYPADMTLRLARRFRLSHRERS